MKIRSIFRIGAVAICAAAILSCQKQPSEEERRAEVEREVQQRLTAEHLSEQQQTLAQQQAELDARQKALADQQAAATQTPEPAIETPPTTIATRTHETRDETSDTRPAAAYGMFYQKLEPYGDWIETNDYGYVWQPRDAEGSRKWRPYTNGHWVYTDAGWTWISDEPYGWATCHYGRWAQLRDVGWVWVPGEEWAPAWVSWRQSDRYVGWAPLPPEAHVRRGQSIRNWADSYYDIGPEEYVFVPSDDVGAQRLAEVAVPTQQNVTIVNETKNITNITYNNTTIVNQGPNYDALRTRSRQPIERYRLERETAAVQGQPQAVVRGEVIALPAPAVAAVAGFERPQAVKRHIAAAQVEHGWQGIGDSAAAEEARQKMHAEATAPPDAPAKRVVKTEAAPAANASPTPPSAAPAAPTAPAATPTIAPERQSVAPESSRALSPSPSSIPAIRSTPGSVPGGPSSTPGHPASRPGSPASVPGHPSLLPGAPGSSPGRPSSTPGRPSSEPGSPGSLPARPGLVPGTPGSSPARPNVNPGRPRPTAAAASTAPASANPSVPPHTPTPLPTPPVPKAESTASPAPTPPRRLPPRPFPPTSPPAHSPAASPAATRPAGTDERNRAMEAARLRQEQEQRGERLPGQPRVPGLAPRIAPSPAPSASPAGGAVAPATAETAHRPAVPPTGGGPADERALPHRRPPGAAAPGPTATPTPAGHASPPREQP